MKLTLYLTEWGARAPAPTPHDSMSCGHWLEGAGTPSTLRWAAAHAAVLSHAYWIAVSFSAMFTGREGYLSILAVAYASEHVVWNLVRAALGGGVAPPVQAQLLTIVSASLTFEVELCGVFLGFLVFHTWFYWARQGVARVGSKLTVVLLGVAAPVAMVCAGWNAGAVPLSRYLVHWGTGVVGGGVRGAAIACMYTNRPGVWSHVLWGRYDLPLRDAILRGTGTSSVGPEGRVNAW